MWDLEEKATGEQTRKLIGTDALLLKGGLPGGRSWGKLKRVKVVKYIEKKGD